MKIVWFSDFDLRGSGYLNLSVPLCAGLADLGHEVKVAALGYQAQEHFHNFSLIPAFDMGSAMNIIGNLNLLWKFDVLIVALDIPLQEKIIQAIPSDRTYKYVGIMPVEADPLCMPWAMVLMQMDKSLVISEFGTKEAQQAGVTNVDHIRLGIDTTAWRPPSAEERASCRQSIGVSDEDFVVLTVADNQERKNLSACMEIIREMKDLPIKYVLVTREHNYQGWRLRDYAQEIGIQNNFILFERGMDFQRLWSIYAASDAFLLGSKAEGLGMPLLEAMAVGIPVVATNCTAIAEVCGNNRGLLAQVEYMHRDPFGNGMRYWIDKAHAEKLLRGIYDKSDLPDLNKARRYVEGRTWQEAVTKLDDTLSEINEQTQTK